jgi:hypothetical protein
MKESASTKDIKNALAKLTKDLEQYQGTFYDYAEETDDDELAELETALEDLFGAAKKLNKKYAALLILKMGEEK